MKKTMKALYTERPGSFGLQERPVPVPGHGEVLLKVASCGVCHTDIIIRTSVAHHVTYPFIPGHEYSGTIVEIGPGVSRVRVGERGVVQQIIPNDMTREYKLGSAVCRCEHHEMGCELDGGMAEYCVLPERNFLKMPDDISFDEGAFTEPMSNAGCCMWTAQVQPMDTVVIVGPGPIGICAAKIATFYGAGRVILVGTRDGRLNIARDNDFGVDEVVNIREPGAEERLLHGLLGGKGADVVMEASGTLSALDLCLRIAGKGCRIVCEGTPEKDALLPFNILKIPDGASIHRVSSWREIDFYNSLQYIATRKIDVKPLITHRFPLAEWEKAFEMATTGKDSAIKVMLYND